jgi:hypothetical protein
LLAREADRRAKQQQKDEEQKKLQDNPFAMTQDVPDDKQQPASSQPATKRSKKKGK